MVKERPVTFYALWHVMAAALLFCVVGLRFGVPPWRYDVSLSIHGLILGAGYLVSIALVHWRGASRRPIDLVVAGLAGYSPMFLYLFLTDQQFSRVLMLAGLACAGVLMAGAFAGGRFRKLRLMAVATALILTASVPDIAGTVLNAPTVASVTTSQIPASLYTLQVTTHRNVIPRTESHHSGGGLDYVEGMGYVIVTSDGALLVAREVADEALRTEVLPYRVPLNRDDFTRASGPGSFVNYFRAFDVVGRQAGDTTELLVSHHRWNVAEACFTVQISSLRWTGTRAMPPSGLEWNTRFTSQPCLPLVMKNPSWPFRGMEGGGRMVLMEPDSLILTLGDQGFNGVDFPTNYVQDVAAAYGKSIMVDLTNGSWKVFSIGHRNPQGLWADSTGVWLTEHGPQGGDEINLLTRGSNYGWPFVTYGTDYGRHVWPINPSQGRHAGYAEPMHSWIPSVGASNLIRIRGTLFADWRGDILMSSLVAKALWRLRVSNDRVVLIERIDVGDRIRDLVEGPTGKLVLLTDSYSLMVLSATRHAYALCAACHGPVDGSAPRLGPSLHGVVGRPVAAQPFDYSETLRSLGGNWTEDRLDRFLQDPQAYAPGTTMIMHGIGDAATRKEIIEYLKRNL